jgi:hypothetical protein
MLKERDMVVLTRDLPEHGLQRGDVGTVVHVHGSGTAYEVEFVDGDGRTLAQVTLTLLDIAPMHGRVVLHVRELA